MKILLTGAAGFIGFHTALSLLQRGDTVVGIDNLNSYYDVSLKEGRLKRLQDYQNFRFIKLDIVNLTELELLYRSENFQRVIHLAAQAGVRYSLQNPRAYIDSNVVGFVNVLECCRHNKIEHFVFASSSSVYGANTRMPFDVSQNVDHPLSLYAATKKANELMAHSYAHLYGLPVTGLRFFTVYGPWGRPDMALFTFTKSILEGTPIKVFNNGKHMRDFTYVTDIVNGVVSVVDRVAEMDPKWSGFNPDPSRSNAPYRLYNIGNNRPIELIKYIETLEVCLGKKADKIFLPLQAGDVPDTFANIDALASEFGYLPNTQIEQGIGNFVDWYLSYYK